MQQLFDKGEVSAQDRDHAEAAVRISQANVEALEEAVRAESAAVEVAQANRKQVDVRKSAIEHHDRPTRAGAGVGSRNGRAISVHKNLCAD